MAKSEFPYDKDRKESFWRTAVASVNPDSDFFEKLAPRLDISESSKLVSAGSCFAQHIGKWLTENQYNYIRSQINLEEISSFAFGNIYTPASLTQWFLKSETQMSEFSVFLDEKNGRWYDLLLPNLNSAGYTSKEDLLDLRRRVISEAKLNLANADFFIFTLGLIEIWIDENGVCYPVCPGLKLGDFDNNKYSLKVFNYFEIYNDVTLLLEEIKKINSNINFILTVSPVPLTATATDQHILKANTYSKSVLRAVAGEISENRSDVDYFPSFELITTPLKNDFRFLENRRTVSKKGVAFVMKHWADSLSSNSTKFFENTNYEVDCDEEMLDSIFKNKEQASMLSGIKSLILVGDSHFAKLSKSFEKLGVDFVGGMVMNGSGFAQNKFLLTGDIDIFIPLESAGSRSIWQTISNNLQSICSKNLQDKSFVITNIGHQTHQTVSMFMDWIRECRPENLTKITMQDFIDFFNEKLHQQLSIIFSLKSQGHRILVVSDTPFWQYFEESKQMYSIVMAYMESMEYLCKEFGIEYFNAARVFNEEVTNPESYTSDLVFSDGSHDFFHGGQNYYDWVCSKLMHCLKM